MLNLKFEEVKDEIANKYGIRRYRLIANDNPTKKFIITKINPETSEEKIITITGSFYKIIPNELVLEIADEVFKEWSANPLNIEKPVWARSPEYSNFSVARHVISNGIRLHAYYTYGSEKVGDDEIYFGVNVINSIDGTTKLGIGGFTYRVKCKNQVLFGQKAFDILLKKQGMTSVKKHLIEGEVIERIVARHTKINFPDKEEVAKIFSHFDKIIDSLKQVIEIYRNLQQINLNKEIAERLAESLPNKMLPEYIQVEKNKLVGLLATPNMWKTYNDITQRIWHNPAGSLVYREKLYDKLHEVVAEVIQ